MRLVVRVSYNPSLSGTSLLFSFLAECSWNTWGFNCSGTCNCTDNTTTCNTVTGLCPEGELTYMVLIFNPTFHFSTSDEINCASNPCGMNAMCVDISLGVYQCYCPSGYILIDYHDCVGESYTLLITLTLYMHINFQPLS